MAGVVIRTHLAPDRREGQGRQHMHKAQVRDRRGGAEVVSPTK